MKKYDRIRVDIVRNGYHIVARLEGRTPQSYAYTDSWIAATADEAAIIVRNLLNEMEARGETR